MDTCKERWRACIRGCTPDSRRCQYRVLAPDAGICLWLFSPPQAALPCLSPVGRTGSVPWAEALLPAMLHPAALTTGSVGSQRRPACLRGRSCPC